MEEDTNFGVPQQNKKGGKGKQGGGKQTQQMPEKKKPKPENTAAKEEVKQKIVKDQVVTAGEDVVDVDTQKQPSSIVFIGHVDAGKSTISG